MGGREAPPPTEPDRDTGWRIPLPSNMTNNDRPPPQTRLGKTMGEGVTHLQAGLPGGLQIGVVRLEQVLEQQRQQLPRQLQPLVAVVVLPPPPK